MNTPIVDFVRRYAETAAARFHMPGHKGKGPLGIEALDLTEISGADELYHAEGIIAESEENASRLFQSRKTVYSTEGSTQCIKAMLYLAVQYREQMRCRSSRCVSPGGPEGEGGREAEKRPWILAARNAHKAFVFAAGLLDLDVAWIWPEETDETLVSCTITAERFQDELAEALKAHGDDLPAAVYLTSPDYLGSCTRLDEIAAVCHARGILLLVDNAHGAYLHFLPESLHPLDHGADICCDSAHKTLPVLTGGAYLHIGKAAPQVFRERAERAMELFCSTSPSYLIMESLDYANAYLADGYRERLSDFIQEVEALKRELRAAGFDIPESDPLRITILSGDGIGMHQCLRKAGMECEYADREHLVIMLTPENGKEALEGLRRILLTEEVMNVGRAGRKKAGPGERKQEKPRQLLSIREALLRPSEKVPADCSAGRICAAPGVSCPPAVPIAVSGELITEEMQKLFQDFGIRTADVVAECKTDLPK